MNTATRLIAGALGAGALAVTGAGLASAATTATPTDTGAPSSPGHLTPEPGGTATYVLPGVAAPLPDPTLGVPDALGVAVLPLALLSDAAGEGGSGTNSQGSPGSAEG
jgi:hypothetical protein